MKYRNYNKFLPKEQNFRMTDRDFNWDAKVSIKEKIETKFTKHLNYSWKPGKWMNTTSWNRYYK